MIENYDSLIKPTDLHQQEMEKEKRIDQYDLFLKRLKSLKKTHKKCPNCVDGIDGETCGNVTYAGVCQDCEGSGWVKR